jgi:hypothetical protein
VIGDFGFESVELFLTLFVLTVYSINITERSDYGLSPPFGIVL